MPPQEAVSSVVDEQGLLRVQDAGRLDYASGLALQERAHAETLGWREAEKAPVGSLLLLEHDPPVITISRRPEAAQHLLASPEQLASEGVQVASTNRGGDITYHGPGQLVAYPILDLNRLGLNLHGYMRWLEEIVIRVCGRFGVRAHRDACATGVWVGAEGEAEGADGARRTCQGGASASRKICAMGVRVRKWVTMHGLALNVRTNLRHFDLIVPCGLAGRGVTSLAQELGEARCPTMEQVKAALAQAFLEAVRQRLREGGGSQPSGRRG